MAVDDTERLARMVLSGIVEPGDADACRLVREYSGVELLRRLQLPRAEGSSKVAGWAGRASTVAVDEIIRAAEELGARYVCPGDDEWWTGLDDLERLEDEPGERRGGAPFGLWLYGGGSLRALSSRCVAIVGSRASTPYGDHMASDLASGATKLGFSVVSGGAYGIDAAAHRAVLAQDWATLAVLAGGVDRLYPSGNSSLLREIGSKGLLISEAAPGGTPTKSRFLVRNRLIAALSQGTVVVEAALRSGALNTARWSQDLGRAVMGVPGPVTSMASGGVHELLRQPGTLLVTDAAEVIEHISPAGEGLAPRKAGAVHPIDHLDLTSRQVLDATPVFGPAPVDAIARTAGISPEEVSARLRVLHTAGLVVSVADGWTLAPA